MDLKRKNKLGHFSQVSNTMWNLVSSDATIEGDLKFGLLSSGKNPKKARRKWKQVHAALHGSTIYMFNHSNGEPWKSISIDTCLVDISYSETKRKNMFRLSTKDSEYLFQTQNEDLMLTWIQNIQLNSKLDETLMVHKIQQHSSRKQKQLNKSVLKEGENRTMKTRMMNFVRMLFKKKEASAVQSFGVKLDQCPPAQNHPFVPLIVESCCNIVEQKGLEHVGIYRVPGKTCAINRLQQEVDTRAGEVCVQDEDLNVISSLLKSFFRKIAEPLFTDEKYNQFINVSRNKDPEKRLEALKNLVLELPVHHYETPKFLTAHLRTVAENSDKNKMDIKNLAIVFGPTLVRTSVEDLPIMLSDMVDQQNIVETLIHNYELFFLQ